MVVTCDGSTTHFDSGCDLLLFYDTNNDGIIDSEELKAALDDFMLNGILTEDEIDFVGLAHDNASIIAVCAGCGADPCENVVCDNICVGTDLYSQVCDPNTGNCITDQLLETNSASCGYVPDPCENVVCDDVCIGTDLYSQKCDPNTGNCITDQLLETNSASCGYVPDPCENVVCDNICVGTDLYSQVCDPNTGNCITDQLLETNSASCEYVPPEEPSNNYTLIIFGIAGALLLKTLLEKNK